MKLKYVALVLFGFSACLACSTKNLESNNKNNTTPQSENNNYQDIEKYTITFDLNGGTYNSSPTFELDDVLRTSYWKFVAKRAPGSTEMPITYPNRTFKGYSLSKDDSTNLLNDSYIVKNDMTVYAQYDVDPSKDCAVQWFDKDGTTKLDEETYVVGEIPNFKKLPYPEHAGEVFDHWYPTPIAITQDQADAGTPVTYQAVYVPADKYYTVTLDYNTGASDLHYQYIVKDKGQCASEPTITYAGHTLTNWTYIEGGEGEFTFNTPITKDIKIQAQWDVDVYNITYVTNGGTLTSSDTEAKYHEAVIAPVLANRPGYDTSKVEWYKTPNFSGSKFVFGGDSSDIESDTTLYAKWPSISQVTVTFQGNGGVWDTTTTKKEVTVDYGNPVYPPKNPTLTDNTFLGWYTLAEGGEEVDFSIGVTANKEVFAHWKVTTNFTITFDSDGGSAVDAITVPTGASITEPTIPTKPGYTFTKWTVDGSEVTFPYTVTANKTFKAVYSANTYKVQFNPNGGTWSDSTTIAKDISGSFNTMPDLQGATVSNGQYVFTGWKRLSDDGIGIIPFAAKDGTYVETYTAQWGGTIYHTVTFDSKGGSAIVSQRIVEGQTATEPETTPIKDGYTFVNWYKEGEAATTEFDFATQINEDITLNANWEAVTPTVNWYTEDGDLIDTKIYDYNDPLELPADSKIPAIIRGRNRFLFKKWLPNATVGTPVVEDMDFYGIYEENNVINFNFSSESFTIDGKSSFTEVFDYSEVNAVSYTFDVAPGENDVALKVNDEVVEDGYEYDAVNGIINIDLHNSVFDKAIKITLEAK